MTVKEMIEKLSTQDQNAQVAFNDVVLDSIRDVYSVHTARNDDGEERVVVGE